VLIQHGKDHRHRQRCQTPKDIKEIDATVEYVMPGIIDAIPISRLNAVNEATNPITPEVKVVMPLIL
jgi:hypothetical protein